MLGDILSNLTLICGFVAWLICQALKIVTTGIKTHEWQLRHFWDGGGMPSSHTAAAIAVTMTVGFCDGFSSTLFAACMIFSCIVMYDAAGVRRETGKQGKLLNEILGWIHAPSDEVSSGDMKERIGHSPLEVATGAVMGILCAFVFRFFM